MRNNARGSAWSVAAVLAVSTLASSGAAQAEDPPVGSEDFSSYVDRQGDPHAFDPLDRPNISLQATSTIPVNDDRIAALWTRNAAGNANRECTANHISGKFWLTAHHCVSADLEMLAYLEQSDGEVAGVENIYTLSETDDVALLKVGRGITATTFTLPDRTPAIGKTVTLIGYGRTNDFSSEATSTITGYRDELHFGDVSYRDLLEATAATLSRSCEGDSGGAVFAGDTLYAVHTASGTNLGCRDGEGAVMWHTNLASRGDWINSVMAEQATTSTDEHRRAYEGLGEKVHELPDKEGGHSASSGSSLSSSY